MHITKLRKVGGSITLTVPPAILDLLHLGVGSTVALAVDGNRLVVDSKMRPSYTLDDLLAQCDVDTPLSEEDHQWIDTYPVGLEL